MMTKKELFEILIDVPDNAKIGCLWDDCEWEIDGIFILSEDKKDEFDILIDCS